MRKRSSTQPEQWPERPPAWPEVMTDVEVCQYLRLDTIHDSPASAKRTLRFIRRTDGLPDLGRIANRVLFRRAAVDAWLVEREQRESRIPDPRVTNSDVVSQ